MNLLLKIAALGARILPQELKKLLYHIPPLAKIIRNTLNAVAPQGLMEVPIVAGELQGTILLLDLQKEKDYWLGTYELDLQAAAHKYCQPGMVVYDVGANIGYISLIFARLVGESGQVFAFESLPKNVGRLKKNIALNHMEKRVIIIPAAVVDRSGETSFLVHASGAMGKAQASAGRAEVYKQTISVPCVSLDDFIFKQEHSAPNLVKMDIEGGEVLAIEGMQRVLIEKRPTFFIELHGQEAVRIICEYLIKVNYKFFNMETGNPCTTDTAQLGEKAYIVAMPKKD
ncbi:MAG TPA: FkbM family methyltransferase [Anaerolineae bacterium]|nr:FkbM family methyltransferase [Anaerolineae bacterium]